MRKLFTFILFTVVCIAFAQSPKHEFRATWLATVWHLDWPKTSGAITTTGDTRKIAAQKKEMLEILDSLSAANMNAVFFQVRSRCDAMYNSKYEPWSSDIVSPRGLDPGYDPLQFVIDEGHKRGLEVHAWMNPYRYESSISDTPWNGPNDYATTHPDWILDIGNSSILNPGMPEVRQRITDVVDDVIGKYDVDGIVFDDYFYLQGIVNEDSREQQMYKPADMDVKDWRRNNVNAMIAQVYKRIQEVKPYVRFGVSPAGIWDAGKAAADKYGINNSPITAGFQYNGIYSDPVAWLNEGSIDYISPQIYWTIDSKSDYRVLSEWWSYVGRHFNRHFYSSHTLSGLDATLTKSFKMRLETVPSFALSGIERSAIMEQLDAEKRMMIKAPISRAFGTNEICNQVQCNRDYDENDAPGSVFYSTLKFYTTDRFINILRANKFNTKVLPPAIFWKQHADYGMVSNIAVSGSSLNWNAVTGNVRYAVYAIPLSEVNLATALNAKNLLGISYSNKYTLPKGISATSHTFAVAVLDRFGNEYAPSLKGVSVTQTPSPTLISPASGAPVVLPTLFEWNAVPGATLYRLEVSEKADFSILLAARETAQTSLSSAKLFPMAKDKSYYWRVISRKLGAKDGVSVIRGFGAMPFNMITPANNSENLSLTPNISWTSVGNGVTYRIEIAEANTFGSAIIFSKELKETSFIIPEEILVGFSTYYVRVIIKVGGQDESTDVVTFKTGEYIPNVPVLLSPTNGVSLNGKDILVSWQKEPFAKSFRVELAKDNNFLPRQTKIKSTEAFTYQVTYKDIDPGTYYLRARSEYSTLWTAWSDVIVFSLGDIVGVKEQKIVADVSLITTNGERQLIVNIEKPTKIEVTVYSVQGSKVGSILEKQTIEGSCSISLPLLELPTGAYLLRVQMDGMVKTLKFIK
ncbi:MAG: family 10 glycosylhydrolase [Bacteroides sp.]